MTSNLADSKSNSSSFDHEKFKNILSGIQSLVIAIAVIAGGLWTFFTFSYLGAAEKAKADLFKQSIVDIEVEAKQEPIAGDEGLYIAAIVQLANRGNRNTILKFQERNLNVYKISFKEDGTWEMRDPVIRLPLGDFGIMLRSGSTQQYPFVFRVQERGFYLLSFEAGIAEPDIQTAIETGGGFFKDEEFNSKGLSWIGVTYVHVK